MDGSLFCVVLVRLLHIFMIEMTEQTIEFIYGLCWYMFIQYIKYNNICSTVSQLNVSKADSRFDLVMLLVLENKKW